MVAKCNYFCRTAWFAFTKNIVLFPTKAINGFLSNMFILSMMALNKIISLYIPDFATVDPVYLALKQATGIYGRRGSSAHNFDSATPSPRNLSDASLQDSGYAEASYSRGPLVGSTPQLDQSGNSSLTWSGKGKFPTVKLRLLHKIIPEYNNEL